MAPQRTWPVQNLPSAKAPNVWTGCIRNRVDGIFPSAFEQDD
jgi:hypothetical protein